MSTFIGMGVSKKETSKEENKKVKTLTETVDTLTKKNGNLEAEKVVLTETVDTLTKQIEDLKKLVEDSKKKSKE